MSITNSSFITKLLTLLPFFPCFLWFSLKCRRFFPVFWRFSSGLLIVILQTGFSSNNHPGCCSNELF
ncbi:hypothetical protein FB451DRAFT_1291289 [Mycena latifolia]|nr:hypothetical protein FB451DRAFT_1316203 [Mycena latifolia]KAJ7446719.1 hypothetical protein FB451DRAFT_1291289 [Mycena latifolia]